MTHDRRTFMRDDWYERTKRSLTSFLLSLTIDRSLRSVSEYRWRVNADASYQQPCATVRVWFHSHSRMHAWASIIMSSREIDTERGISTTLKRHQLTWYKAKMSAWDVKHCKGIVACVYRTGWQMWHYVIVNFIIRKIPFVKLRSISESKLSRERR